MSKYITQNNTQSRNILFSSKSNLLPLGQGRQQSIDLRRIHVTQLRRPARLLVLVDQRCPDAFNEVRCQGEA